MKRGSVRPRIPLKTSSVRLRRIHRLTKLDADIAGLAKVSHEDVLKALRRLAAGEFPKQSRPKVQPEGVSQVPGVSLGLVAGLGTGNKVRLSKGSRLLPRLTTLLCRFMSQHDPDFAFSSIQVNYGFASRDHVDTNNMGPSYIYGVGDFDGGELWVERPNSQGVAHVCTVDIYTANGALLYRQSTTYNGVCLDVKGCWHRFDGRRLHFTKPIIRGERFSMIFYSLVRHAKAIASERETATKLGFRLPDVPPPVRLPVVVAAPRVWTCVHCGKEFPSSSRMFRHAKVHVEAAHICSFPGCGRSFRRVEQLHRHACTHLEVRPWRCSFPGCGKSFADAWGLRRHSKRHEQKTPFLEKHMRPVLAV